MPSAAPALLAQLVEHFHGKEGVIGSSPMEGLDRIPRSGGVSCLRGSANPNPSPRFWGVSGALWGALRPTTPSGVDPFSTSGGGYRPVSATEQLPLLMSVRYRTPFDDLQPSAVLRPEDIALRLGVSARSVRRAIGRGELKASRACGLRVLAADAADWWTARVVVRVQAQRITNVRPAPSDHGQPVHSPAHERRPGRRIAPSPTSRLPLPPRGGGS